MTLQQGNLYPKLILEKGKWHKSRIEMNILFDDIVKDNYGTWTQICKRHSELKEINLLGTLEPIASENAICGCIGCQNKADYYLDFY